jgi:hypothetical protein
VLMDLGVSSPDRQRTARFQLAVSTAA